MVGVEALTRTVSAVIYIIHRTDGKQQTEAPTGFLGNPARQLQTVPREKNFFAEIDFLQFPINNLMQKHNLRTSQNIRPIHIFAPRCQNQVFYKI